MIQLAADLGALPPGDVTHTVHISTNSPYTASAIASVSYAPSLSASVAQTGIVLAVPWSVSVIQAFVFPETLAFTVSPLEVTTPKYVTVVNFAGDFLLVAARLPALSMSWMLVDTTDVRLPDNDVAEFGFNVAYPIVDGALAPPGTYAHNASVIVWRETQPDQAPPDAMSSSDIIRVLNATNMRPVALDKMYVFVAQYNITVVVEAAVGIPSAIHCETRLLSPNTTRADGMVLIEVVMRDAGGFLVAFDDTAMVYLSITATMPPSPRKLGAAPHAAARRLNDNVAVLQAVTPGPYNASFILSFRPRVVGDAMFSVAIRNQLVQVLNVTFLHVNCPGVFMI